MTEASSANPDIVPFAPDPRPALPGEPVLVPRQRGGAALTLAPEPVDAPPTETKAPAARPHQPGADVRPTLLIADVVVLGLTILATSKTLAGMALLVVAVLSARVVVRAYRPRLQLSALDELPRLLIASCISLGLLLGMRLVFFGGRGVAVRSVVQVALVLLLSFLATAIGFALLRAGRRRGVDNLPATLVVGSTTVAATLDESLRDHPELGLRSVGVLGGDAGTGQDATADLSSHLARITSAIDAADASVVILAHEDSAQANADSIIAVHQTGAQLFVVPSVFELFHDGPDVDRVRGIPLIRLRRDPMHRLTWWIKRASDVVLSSIGLVLVLPILAAAAVAILIDSGRPVLFRQTRIGRNGRPFELLKLRSMRPATTTEGDTRWNIAEDPRLSRLGKLLRRTSIDELPQLWNVVRGQMSLVGPRPERPSFVSRFSAEHERYWARHRVPAGLTGLAQVNGLRGDTSIRERARYDNYYIANWSLWLDLKVILLTVREVFGARGR